MKNNKNHLRLQSQSPLLCAFISVVTVIFSLAATQITAQSLQEYLTIAGENNPNLKAKFLEYQAALERLPQVGALPDPQLSFNFFVMPMERHMGNQIGSISIMQMFPWLGTLSAAEDEMSHRAKARFEEFNEAKSELFFQLKVNWYAMHFLENEIAITKESIDLLKTIEEIIISRFRSGGIGKANPETVDEILYYLKGETVLPDLDQSHIEILNASISKELNIFGSGRETQSIGAGMVDVLRVQMEINTLENQLLLLQDNRIPLLAAFNKMLNRPAEEYVNLNDSISKAQLPVSLTEIPDSIKNNNPMLKILEREEAALLARGSINRNLGMPTFGAGLQYEIFKKRDNSESGMNGRNMIMPMFTISIPIWRSKYNASVSETEFLRQSVVEKKEDINNQLMVNFEEAMRNFRDAERRTTLYKEQTSLAGQVLNLLIVQYSTNGSDFEEVLRMQQQLLDYRLRQIEALIDGNIATAMMERLMGR